MSCEWKQDAWEEYNLWETSCGQTFQLTDSTPTANSFRFCVYCGKPLIEIIAQLQELEEDA